MIGKRPPTPINNEMNMDASGILSMFNFMWNRKNQISDETFGNNSFRKLNDFELEQCFRSSHLIQKIIRKYPYEAYSIGYEIVDSNGNVIGSNDVVILEAFKEASIYSRLYSRCLLYLDLDDSDNDENPVRKGGKLIGYKIYFEMQKEGDFFLVEGRKIHQDRILDWIGVRSYSKVATLYDIDYADSVLQGLFDSFNLFAESNKNIKFILDNISYLTVGIDNLGNMTKSSEGRSLIMDRLLSININRSIYRSIAYDKKSELVSFVSQTIAGVREILEELKNLFVAETDYPMEELFEQASSQKLGSGIQNQLIARYLWARRCRNWTKNNWLPHYKTILNRLMDMSAYEINIPFTVDLTDEERANIENIGADRIKKLVEAGVLTPNEARTGYRGNEYSLNIELGEDSLLEQIQSSQAPGASQIEKSSSAGTQEDSIPDNKFWDNLANITEEDLTAIAEEILAN